MNLIKAITFLLCSTLLVGQTTPIRNPQIQGASGAIISGATLTNSGTFVNSGTLNGAGTFNLGSGTVTLPATVSGLGSWAGVNSITTLGTITTGTWNATPIGVSYGGSGQTSLAASIQAYLDAISTTQGTVLYNNGTDWVALAPGTSGHYLKTQGAGANPVWAASTGTGSVTSVAVSGSDGIDIDSGSPITTSGTIALGINASTLKTHLSLNNVENTALSTWAGTTSLTTLGTVSTGTWNATAIAVNKVAAITADRLVVTDGSGFISASSVTATQAGYLSGVTSAIQTQLDAKASLTEPVFIGSVFNRGSIGIRESALNGTNKVTVQAPLSIASDYLVTLPSVAGALISEGDTGTVTNTMLANSAITIAGVSTSLGGTITASTIIQTGLDGIGSSNGALVYRGPVSWSALAAGTTGHFLKQGSTFSAPEWSEITLGTNTAGNFVSGVSGTSNEISVSHTPSEGSTATISLPAAIDLGGKTSLEIPNGTAPTVDATGEVALDTTTTNFQALLTYHDGTSQRYVPAILAANMTATDGYVIKYDAASDEFILGAASGGGGGLTNITETLRTTSPNATINVEELAVSGGTTNTDLLLKPMGTGAFIVFNLPDGTATGGNKRGSYAIDFQPAFRNSAADVASGAHSVIIAGRYNKASGDYSFAGGYFNTVTGYAAYGYGYQQTASGNYTGALSGYQNTASGTASVVPGGQLSTASGDYSSAIGYYANATRYGQRAAASGVFAALGDAQAVDVTLRCKTTTNSAVEMGLDGSTTYLTIPSGKVVSLTVQVTGVKSDGSAVAHYIRQYSAKNVGGTSSEVYAEVTIGTDNAAGTSLDISTVDAGDYISIKPTGISAEVWRWVARVEAVEAAYGN